MQVTGGKVKSYLLFDINGFCLQYNNRVGSITQQRIDGSFYNYRTNVGSSKSNGIEALVELSFTKAFAKEIKTTDLSAFVSYSYTNAKYNNLKVVTKSGNNLVETNLKNKKIENAPENIVRTGVTYTYKGLTVTTQISYVGASFSDANNTVTPTANGQTGLITAYTVADFTATYRWNKNYNIKADVDNMLDEKYFTRRAVDIPARGYCLLMVEVFLFLSAPAFNFQQYFT